MFDLAIYAIMGLVMGIISVRILIQTVRERKTLFADRFTRASRQHLSTAAFFLLVPITVFFHELGHAVAVWIAGGEVEMFGFFLFFGFVSHRGFYTPEDLFWIALAGNLVSIAFGVGAISWVLLRPMRAAWNYLLLMFGIINLLISLVFYPALDFAGGIHGDWSQIYTSDTPMLSGAMGVLHGLLLLVGIVAWRSNRARARYAELTGLNPEAVRRINKDQATQELLDAGNRVASESSHAVGVEQSRFAAPHGNDMTGVQLQWTSAGHRRSIHAVAVVAAQKRVEIIGAAQVLDGTERTRQQPITSIDGIPGPDQISSQLKRAFDVVDTWRIE